MHEILRDILKADLKGIMGGRRKGPKGVVALARRLRVFATELDQLKATHAAEIAQLIDVAAAAAEKRIAQLEADRVHLAELDAVTAKTDLKAELPALMTITEYCTAMRRARASAYKDLKRIPGLAVKLGKSTRIVRDVMLAEMANLPVWTPEKDRT